MKKGRRISKKTFLKILSNGDNEDMVRDVLTDFIPSLLPSEVANMFVNYGDNGEIFEVCCLVADYDDDFIALSKTEKTETIKTKLFDLFAVREHLRTKERLIECISNLFV